MTFSMAIHQIRELSADDITHIVADYVELKRSGRGMKGQCPFHDEKTPSFHVSDEKGIYKCFGCGLGGDAIDFLMRMDGKEFHEVIFQLADRFHLTIDQNNQDRQSTRLQKETAAISNIKEIRSEIRKEEKVTMVLNDAYLNQFDTRAITQITPPVKEEQLHVIRKYTDQCMYVLTGIEWEKIKPSIQAALSQDLSVYIWSEEKKQDWLHYILFEQEVGREEVIELLACIQNELTRSVYSKEYSNLLNRMHEKY